MHLKPQCHPTDHAPCLGRRARTNRRPSSHSLGKAHLQAAQGDGRTFLCRRQTTSRPPLRPLPRALGCHRPVPARRCRSEHQENRPCSRSKARLRLSSLVNPSTNTQKQNPAKIGGVCQRSEAAHWGGLFFFSMSMAVQLLRSGNRQDTQFFNRKCSRLLIVR